MTRIRVVGLLLTSSMLLASPLAFAKKKKSAEFVPEEGASGDQCDALAIVSGRLAGHTRRQRRHKTGP